MRSSEQSRLNMESLANIVHPLLARDKFAKSVNYAKVFLQPARLASRMMATPQAQHYFLTLITKSKHVSSLRGTAKRTSAQSLVGQGYRQAGRSRSSVCRYMATKSRGHDRLLCSGVRQWRVGRDQEDPIRFIEDRPWSLCRLHQSQGALRPATRRTASHREAYPPIQLGHRRDQFWENVMQGPGGAAALLAPEIRKSAPRMKSIRDLLAIADEQKASRKKRRYRTRRRSVRSHSCACHRLRSRCRCLRH